LQTRLARRPSHSIYCLAREQYRHQPGSCKVPSFIHAAFDFNRRPAQPRWYSSATTRHRRSQSHWHVRGMDLKACALDILTEIINRSRSINRRVLLSGQTELVLYCIAPEEYRGSEFRITLTIVNHRCMFLRKKT